MLDSGVICPGDTVPVLMAQRTSQTNAVLASVEVPIADPAPLGLTNDAWPDDQTDCDTLFAEFAPLVRRLVRQYGTTPELRQDLPGEIYYRFRVLLEDYDVARGVPLRPYLVRQLTASVYTFARRHWRQERREVSLVSNEGVELRLPAEDPTHEWDQALWTQQVREALPEAIARLPRRQQQVVIWRYYEDRSFEEIAKLLGIQAATARSLLRHGLNALRRWVQKHQLHCEETR